MKQVTLLLILLLLISCTSLDKGDNALEVDETQLDPQFHKAQLSIQGMYCSSCASGLEYELKQLPGVIIAQINYKGSGSVIYDPSKITIQDILQVQERFIITLVDDKTLSES